MRWLLCATASVLALPALSETTITITTNVAVPDARRFGINLGQVNYYDSNQLMKELLYRNPGFEGQMWQSIVPVGSATATNAIEDGPYTAWPSGFWDGAGYEFIWGTAKGRTGTVVRSTAPNRANPPNDPAGSTNGTTYLFDGMGPSAARGDYLLLRKRDTSGTNGGSAFHGWNVSTNGGATAASELADLPAALNPASRQCARLTATAPGQWVQLNGSFDTWNGVSFVQLNGTYRLIFSAKGAGGANQLLVQLRRGGGAYWINQTLPLSGAWRSYTNTFTAAEGGTDVGSVNLQFAPVNQSSVLLDDVSLRQVGGDATNTSEFRDPVVATLRQLNPGFIRYPAWQHLGDSLDNETTPAFARLRSGYSSYATAANGILLGLHEFLGLCETVGADPWFPTPLTYSTHEIANLMEYLGGPTNTTYGARRAALGHPSPWTEAFRRIHIEFGNEAWNPGYRGAAMANSEAYGNRAGEIFSAAKSSPFYAATRFNFILGEQWVVPWRVRHAHDACPSHDSMAVAGYMASWIDSYATTEELFGSLFAEPEWWNKPGGLMYQDYTNLLHSSRPVPIAVYEVNINVPSGGITNSQAALTAYTPSLGAGIAVAGHMLMALRELQARDQGLFNLGGYEAPAGTNHAYVWGVTRDMGVTDRKRPGYLACQLANRALPGDLLETSHAGDDPVWSVTNRNRVTWENAHCLQSHAFANGTNRSAIVFNFHRTTPLAVNFSGPGAPAGHLTWTLLTSTAITDNNESAVHIAPVTQVLSNFTAGGSLVLPPFSMSLLQWRTLSPLESWRLGHLGRIESAGAAADAADPDGDGAPNIAEFAAGTDPLAPTSRACPRPGIATAAGSRYLSLTFQRDTTAAGIVCTVQVSDSLTNWSDGSTYSSSGDIPATALTTETGRAGTVIEMITVRDNSAIGVFPARFMRLKITAP
ncbi:MAG: hypothetical protein IT577_17535 [Verrucomicrobiae bacterium]|nr:hypothetical protein [Verrucomicrobiae bacterium]